MKYVLSFKNNNKGGNIWKGLFSNWYPKQFSKAVLTFWSTRAASVYVNVSLLLVWGKIDNVIFRFNYFWNAIQRTFFNVELFTIDFTPLHEVVCNIIMWRPRISGSQCFLSLLFNFNLLLVWDKRDNAIFPLRGIHSIPLLLKCHSKNISQCRAAYYRFYSISWNCVQYDYVESQTAERKLNRKNF